MKKALPWISIVLIGLLAAVARYRLIQPVEVAHLCGSALPWPQGPWYCEVRTFVILSFSHYGLGYASAALAVLALIVRQPVVAWLAMACGAAGIVLYCYEPAAVALTIGVLVLARHQAGALSPGGSGGSPLPGRPEDAGGKQQA